VAEVGQPFPAPDVELSFSQTVPCEIAHRRALGEVFVADSAQTGRDEFLLALQLPRAHSLWFDRRVPYHDSFSTAEACRQAVFVVLHRYLGVPRDLPFTLETFRCRVESVQAYRDNEKTPLEALLRYRVGNRHSLETEVGTMTLAGQLGIGGVLAMSVSAEIVSMPAVDYGVLRAVQRAAADNPATGDPGSWRPVEPALVGRYDERNVVVAAAEQVGGLSAYPMLLDDRHPSFFDHGYDHLPGPVAVEALRQAALLRACEQGALPSPVAPVIDCSVRFSAFGYLDAPLFASAELAPPQSDGTVELAVGIHQFGKQIVSGSLTFGQYP
jgi:hypothetical protein